MSCSGPPERDPLITGRWKGEVEIGVGSVAPSIVGVLFQVSESDSTVVTLWRVHSKSYSLKRSVHILRKRLEDPPLPFFATDGWDPAMLTGRISTYTSLSTIGRVL